MRVTIVTFIGAVQAMCSRNLQPRSVDTTLRFPLHYAQRCYPLYVTTQAKEVFVLWI
jgi:hypothetical protein